MQAQVRVNAPSNVSYSDGQVYDSLGGKQGEQMVAELHGKYYTQSYRGKLWSASITTATAIPVFATNPTPNFGILNPAGNGTAVVLVKLNVGLVGGTGVAGNIGYAYLKNPGVLLGTLAPVSGYTAGPAIQSGVVGQAYAGNIIFGSAFTIGGAANIPIWHRHSNLSQGAPLTGTAAVYSLFEDFDGTVIVPPGVLWFPIASTAIAETVNMSLIAYEVPYP